jgi:carbon storage regulator
MLVLTRKAGDELVIGEDIRITVNRISGNRVTIGISAPDEVRIVRGELTAIVDTFNEPKGISPVSDTGPFPFVGSTLRAS